MAAVSRLSFSERTFPMMVVSVDDLLQMQTLEPHEVLLRRGVLKEWRPGMGLVSFISHTWLGRRHPDKAGAKLRLLQAFLRAVIAGRMQVDVHYLQSLTVGAQAMGKEHLRQSFQHSFIFLDYWSIPQADRQRQLAAIHSIPSYVGDSAFFICLVPSITHEDGSLRDRRAWKRRGWCRLENTSNALSPTPKPCIVVESMSSIFLDHESDWLDTPVGLGEFTDASDRTVMQPMIQRMVQARQQQAEEEGELDFFRMLEAAKGVLLQGFGSGPNQASTQPVDCSTMLRAARGTLLQGSGTSTPRRPDPESLDQWMAKMRFRPGDESMTGSGWTPLRFAAYLGRQDLVLELLQRGADIHAPLAASQHGLGLHVRGSTILQGVCSLRDDPAMLELLMQHHADPCSQEPTSGFNALHFACARGLCGNIRAIMAYAPEAADVREGLGAQPWVCSCVRGKAEAVRLFLEEFPEKVGSNPRLTVNGWGHGFCSNAVIDVGDLDTLKVILEHQYDVNHVGEVTQTKAWSIIVAAQAICHLQRNPNILMEYVANGPSMSPLCHAAYHGNLGAVQLLLERGADVHQTNAYGRTALAFAAMRGHEGVAELLLRAGASAATPDCWGRSPTEWATRRGHARLAALLRSKGHFQAPARCAAVRGSSPQRVGCALWAAGDAGSGAGRRRVSL